jgi:hypothetical protein
MTNEEAVKLATWKLLGKTDCVGCRRLYLVRNFNTRFDYEVKCDCSRNEKLLNGQVLVNTTNVLPDIQELKGMRCERYTPTRPEYE